MAEPIQRRLAAILAADVVGFSRMMGADEEGTLVNLKAARAELVDPGIARHGGRIFKTTGDGLLAEFPSVVAAVRCAAQIQAAMPAHEAAREPGSRLVFRIGVNLGDVMIEGDDVYGDGVNIAARLEGICQPGGVAISSSAHEQVRGKLEFGFVDCGDHAVKNIAHPVRVFGLDLSTKGISAKGARRSRRLPLWAYVVPVLALLSGIGWSVDGGSVQKVRTAIASLWGKPAPVEKARATIAVMPLENQSGDASREYFSDGITQDIIGALGRFSGLMVISHNSVQAYKARMASPADLARELGVRYIVQGNLRQVQERLRVSLELSDTERGVRLWSERYEGEGKDVFSIQDKIVHQIVGVLAVRITALEQQRAAAKPAESLEAYDMVLRARELILRSDRTANREARRLSSEAVKLAPGFAEAFVTSAAAEWQRAELGWNEYPVEGVRLSEEFAKRALALDDPGAQSRAHAQIGLIMSFRGQYEEALAQVELAMKLNPNDANAQALRASVLLWQGKIDESIAAYATARQFDPRQSSGAGISLALAYFIADRPQETLAVTAESISRYRNGAFLHALRAAAYVQLNDIKAARREAALVRGVNPLFQVDQFGTRFRNPAHQAKIQNALRTAGL
ncbi:MAG: adenylate cyclase [Pseudomonadota bacterium]|nr:adenylate cyclase [Pseudomonadota bacterium]